MSCEKGVCLKKIRGANPSARRMSSKKKKAGCSCAQTGDIPSAEQSEEEQEQLSGALCAVGCVLFFYVDTIIKERTSCKMSSDTLEVLRQKLFALSVAGDQKGGWRDVLLRETYYANTPMTGSTNLLHIVAPITGGKPQARALVKGGPKQVRVYDWIYPARYQCRRLGARIHNWAIFLEMDAVAKSREALLRKSSRFGPKEKPLLEFRQLEEQGIKELSRMFEITQRPHTQRTVSGQIDAFFTMHLHVEPEPNSGSSSLPRGYTVTQHTAYASVEDVPDAFVEVLMAKYYVSFTDGALGEDGVDHVALETREENRRAIHAAGQTFVLRDDSKDGVIAIILCNQNGFETSDPRGFGMMQQFVDDNDSCEGWTCFDATVMSVQARGRGLGGQFVKYVLSEYLRNHLVVLQCIPRIETFRFWTRCGFRVSPFSKDSSGEIPDYAPRMLALMEDAHNAYCHGLMSCMLGKRGLTVKNLAGERCPAIVKMMPDPGRMVNVKSYGRISRDISMLRPDTNGQYTDKMTDPSPVLEIAQGDLPADITLKLREAFTRAKASPTFVRFVDWGTADSPMVLNLYNHFLAADNHPDGGEDDAADGDDKELDTNDDEVMVAPGSGEEEPDDRYEEVIVASASDDGGSDESDSDDGDSDDSDSDDSDESDESDESEQDEGGAAIRAPRRSTPIANTLPPSSDPDGGVGDGGADGDGDDGDGVDGDGGVGDGGADGDGDDGDGDDGDGDDGDGDDGDGDDGDGDDGDGDDGNDGDGSDGGVGDDGDGGVGDGGADGDDDPPGMRESLGALPFAQRLGTLRNLLRFYMVTKGYYFQSISRSRMPDLCAHFGMEYVENSLGILLHDTKTNTIIAFLPFTRAFNQITMLKPFPHPEPALRVDDTPYSWFVVLFLRIRFMRFLEFKDNDGTVTVVDRALEPGFFHFVKTSTNDAINNVFGSGDFFNTYKETCMKAKGFDMCRVSGEPSIVSRKQHL